MTTPAATTPNATTTGGGDYGSSVSPADILALFTKAGIDPSKHGDGSTEDPMVRAQRIANEINTGQRTISDVQRSIDTLQSDPDAQVSGAVTPEQVRAIFEAYGVDPTQHGGGGTEDPTARLIRIANEVNSGQRTMADVALNVGQIAAQGVGLYKPEARLTIMAGNTQRWYYDNSADKWYVGYGTSSGRELIFEATNEQMDALMGPGARPTHFGSVTAKGLLARQGVTFAGNISEMEGEGNFESEVARVTALALDEGLLPDWAAQDNAAMDILFIGQSEGKSNDWILQQFAKLPSFERRFPGMDKLRSVGNLDISEGVAAFLEYEAGVKQALLGVGKDPNVVTPQLVGGLLNKGHALSAIQNTVQGFDRMDKFAPALEAFNQVLAAKGLPPVGSLQERLNFVTGQAPTELYDVWEASSIQEAAQQAGLGAVFTAQDAIGIGLATDQNLETATAASRKAAELLLRLRHEVDVSQFGLDHEELIDLSFGRAPRSGRSEAEVNDAINRAVVTAQKYIQTRGAAPYTSFTATGTPQAASLGNLRQQT
ncbi:MAG TPA: hypothetical protein VM537_28015 [Anaerolineae bacterium]|nr:hypothetical protein [Anaerolineae bacterium]